MRYFRYKERREKLGLFSLEQRRLRAWPGIVEPPIIKVHGEALDNVKHFQYPRCVLSAEAVIDEEILHRLQCASASFGRLRKRGFKSNNIRSNTNIMVLRAVVVPTLLYCSETWTVYSRHLKLLEQFHQ
eukprot:g42387.t1